VDDAVFVSILQRATHSKGEFADTPLGQWSPLLFEQSSNVVPTQLHHEEVDIALLAIVEEGQDIRMAQSGQRLGLSQEPWDAR
jgi:hypothetical protein